MSASPDPCGTHSCDCPLVQGSKLVPQRALTAAKWAVEASRRREAEAMRCAAQAQQSEVQLRQQLSQERHNSLAVTAALRARAEAAEQQLAASQARLAEAAETAEQQRRCVVCLDSERRVVFKKCGHLALCFGCQDTLLAMRPKQRKCPVCCKPVTKTDCIPTFLS